MHLAYTQTGRVRFSYELPISFVSIGMQRALITPGMTPDKGCRVGSTPTANTILCPCSLVVERCLLTAVASVRLRPRVPSFVGCPFGEGQCGRKAKPSSFSGEVS